MFWGWKKHKVALRWTSPGKRPRGRPKTTWRRMVERELKELHMTWGEAESLGQKRGELRSFLLTLCSSWSEENRFRINSIHSLLVYFAIIAVLRSIRISSYPWSTIHTEPRSRGEYCTSSVFKQLFYFTIRWQIDVCVLNCYLI